MVTKCDKCGETCLYEDNKLGGFNICEQCNNEFKDWVKDKLDERKYKFTTLVLTFFFSAILGIIIGIIYHYVYFVI